MVRVLSHGSMERSTRETSSKICATEKDFSNGKMAAHTMANGNKTNNTAKESSSNLMEQRKKEPGKKGKILAWRVQKKTKIKVRSQ